MSDTIVFVCQFCKKICANKRGLNIHKASCKLKGTRACSLIANNARGSSEATFRSENVNIDSEILNTYGATFMWGNKPGKEFIRDLDVVYNKIVFYRQNLFKLPLGSAGKDYIRETTRLIKSWTSKSELKNVARKCIMIMPCLLLQKPSKD